jgi:hypothetical protein
MMIFLTSLIAAGVFLAFVVIAAGRMLHQSTWGDSCT